MIRLNRIIKRYLFDKSFDFQNGEPNERTLGPELKLLVFVFVLGSCFFIRFPFFVNGHALVWGAV